MNLAIEKKNIVRWIQEIEDQKTIEKILILKEKNQISQFEDKLIAKGLKDVLSGKVSSDEDVKKRFEAKFSKK